MPPNNANALSPCGLTIAGVRFALSGSIDPAAFSPAFLPFQHSATAADLDCAVFSAGPDDSLAAQAPEPDKPWTFTVREGVCDLVRRNREGEGLWRIAGPLAFDRATVTWNPLGFAAHYGSYEQAWNTGLGLSLLVLRLRAQGGLVLHGAAAELDGQGILCVGVSGRGKSTISRLLGAAGATVLTDERPVLRQWPAPAAGAVPSTAFRLYGSPWPSSAGFVRDGWAPLRRIYFLEHGPTDRLTPLPPPAAVSRLIHVATIPWQDPALLDPCLATFDTLLRAVPCAVLAFRPTASVVDLIRADLCRPAGRARP
ncbi:MAG: hypothetical protein R6X19_08350 [Kiritimatiellia bacterium]